MEISMNGLSLNLISHPGETLLELLEINAMTQKELAVRLSCTPKHVNEIIKGVKPISNALAVKLENVFGLKASFWNNLQNIYDEQIEKLKLKESVSNEEIQYFKENKNVYKFLVGEKCIEDYTDVTQGVLNLRKFLKINNLLQVGQLLQVNGAYRISDKTKINDLALACWLRLCDLNSDKIKTNEFSENNKQIILQDIKKIRSLSKKNPNVFIKELQKYFSELGISFVVLKNIQGAPVNGLIKKSMKAIQICLTIRGKDADKFWFTLFHELGHLLTNKIEKLYVDYENLDNEMENMANNFANKYLVDDEIYRELISGRISRERVIYAANLMNVLPSIIVGRLQHDKIIEYNQLNNLKTQYLWAK